MKTSELMELIGRPLKIGTITNKEAVIEDLAAEVIALREREKALVDALTRCVECLEGHPFTHGPITQARAALTDADKEEN